MSPRKLFHVADKISCRQKLTHVGAKMISCRQNEFHVAKTFSCHQKCFSCRRKINFMSPIKFHVAEKVHFPDDRLLESLLLWCLSLADFGFSAAKIPLFIVTFGGSFVPCACAHSVHRARKFVRSGFPILGLL